MSGEPAKTRRLRTAEEWLMTALLRMVLARCARPDGTLDSFAWAANAEAMRLLAARGLIRIDDDAGDPRPGDDAVRRGIGARPGARPRAHRR